MGLKAHRRLWRFRSCAAVLLIITAAAVAWARLESKGRWSEEKQLTFLGSHWRLPVPLQGKPPERFSSLEASLDPESCGLCHRPQYEDWQTSRHSLTMGPGPRGQTVDLIERDPETALLCYSCHAPLTEQQEKQRVRNETSTLVDNPHLPGLPHAGPEAPLAGDS
jgi:hypothetical protein